MNNNLKNAIINALKTQKEIFGDELFSRSLPTARKTEVISVFSHSKSGMKNQKSGKQTSASMKETELALSAEPWSSAGNLDVLNEMICNCMKCPLGTTRNKFVFGKGNPEADVMCIGEGPGADEDAKGEPFVGRAGQLLTDILKAIEFSRDEVYIANIVKCRPPGNRAPNTDEMAACIPYLKKQIELIRPKLILCLGLTAAQGLLGRKESLTKMRGNVFSFENAKVMVTYHPAALLRNPNWKRPCWEDVKQFRKLYDELSSNKN